MLCSNRSSQSQAIFIEFEMAVFLIRKPKCVFIHIPKTGGASIRHGFFDGNVEGPKQGFIPDEWQKLYKFAFVRNPYDRVVSAWKMFAGGMENSVWSQPQDEAGVNFKRFLEIAMDESVPYSGNRETTAEKIRHHAIPQTHEFNCLRNADFVGKFENLQHDFAKICQTIGVPFSGMPHWNRSYRNSNFADYYDAETKAIVDNFCARDFDELGYDKSL